MSVLYRKYRPQSFSEMIGQNHIKITLQNQIASGTLGHAYLFCGPRGLGKTTAARILAKSINCENRKEGESEPCNKCSSCLDIIEARSIDIIEIDAASHTGVDNVRENIIENSRFTPHKSKFKVFIIDEVHMLSNAAFNALLKTLEEPPAHVLFILCTTEIHKLPQTIISRCQRFDFKKVSSQQMLDLLAKVVESEKKKIEEEVLKSVVIHSEGCVRDAQSLLGKILSLGDDITMEQAEIILPRANYSIVIEFFNYLVEGNSTAAVELVNKLVEEGVDLQIFSENIIETLRKAILLKVNNNLSDFGIELDEEMHKSLQFLADKMSMERLIMAIELFTQAASDLKSAFIYQLPLELASIKFTKSICAYESTDKDISVLKSDSIKKTETVKEPVPVVQKKTLIEEKIVEKKLEDEEIAETSEKVEIDSKSVTDIKKIKENWEKVSEVLFEKNFTLASLLKISKPIKCKENVLEVAVKSTFYKERLEASVNKKLIEDAITQIVLASVSIKGIVCEDLVIEGAKDCGVRPVFGSEAKNYAPKEDVAIPSFKSPDVVSEVLSMF